MGNTLLNRGDINFFLDLLWKSGNLAVSIQNKGMDLRYKKDDSIVTKADVAVQDLLLSEIGNRHPDFNFIHEEDFDRDRRGIDAETVSVIIDPIDGTAVYSMHLPTWSISIGIFKGYEPVYGFVYSPVSDMLFYNDDNHAYLNGSPVAVDKNIEIGKETSIFYATEVYNRIRISFPGKVRNLGSTALHCALVADNHRNRTIAFIGSSFLWDWAGAIPIVLKAGGSLKYRDGKDIDFKEIVLNSYELPDFCIAYPIDDFEKVKGMFKELEHKYDR